MTRGAWPGLDAALAASRAGDPDGLAELYRQLAPAVLGYLRSQGSADPEDLTGDVFVAVVQGLDRFVGDAAQFRSWVFTIAHRRLVDERRQRHRRRTEPSEPARLGRDADAARRRDAGDDLGDRAAARADASVVRLALTDLTDDQRTVLLLRIVADLSVAQTAEVTGRTPGAVKTLQRRALAALERALEGTPAGGGGPDEPGDSGEKSVPDPFPPDPSER